MDNQTGEISMEFRVLGPLELIRDSVSIDLGSHQQRALLALLLINANRVVTTDRILEEFWRDDPDGKERTLWVYISRLRSILEPDRAKRAESVVLARHDRGYRLNVADRAIDARDFVKRSQEGTSLLKSDPELASTILQEALGLWRGSAFEEFQYEPFAEPEVARLEELRTAAFEDRIEADLRSGKTGELISDIERHMQTHSLRERPVAQLMTALYRVGRPADALRAYGRFKRTLGDELGIEPTPELATLEEQILLHDSRLWVETRRDPAAAQSSVEGRNPYKGLHPFQTREAEDFFGRERLVAETLKRIAAGAGLVSLVGPSGSGKTSVVNAGIIPALETEAVDGSHEWLIVEMVPGAHPFAELEAALNRAASEPSGDLLELLMSGPGGLLRAVLRVLDSTRGRVLLVIDQFEELYTLGSSPDDRKAFLDALTDALSDVHHRLTIITTLRADFYERVLSHAAFSDVLGPSVMNVAAMSAEELEAAAQLPSSRTGVDIEPSLLTSLIMDVIGEPGALPMFQHTLRELYDRRDGNQMTLASYEASGGVRGALARRAEDIYGGLGPDQQDVTLQIFLRLVTISETGERTRRRVDAAELLSLDLPATELEAILSEFSSHRLISFDRDHVTGKPVAEIAHEALLSEWPRLRVWIDEAEDDVKQHERLSGAIDEWRNTDRDPDYLFMGRQLDDYSNWARDTSMLLTSSEQAFLGEAAAKEHDRLETDRSRSLRESDVGRRARRRFWGLISTAGILVAILALIALNALETTPTVAVIHQGRSEIDTSISEGIARAGIELDVDVIEITPPWARLEDEVREAVRNGATLVIVDQFYEPFVLSLSEPYPEVQFEILERTTTGEGYAIEEGAFLMGAAAALEATDSSVGFVGAVQDRRSERLRAGFEAGVHDIRPSIEVLAGYALSSKRSDVAAELATQAAATAVFDRGATIIFNVAQDRGVLEAAFAQAATGRHVYSIGAFTDEYLSVAPSRRQHVISSLVVRYDGVVFSMIKEYIDNGDATPDREWDIADGALWYTRSSIELAPVFDNRVEGLIKKITSDDFEIPLVPAGDLMPIPGSYETAQAKIVFDGEQCTFTGPDAAIGVVVDVEFVNDGTTAAFLAVGSEFAIEIPASAGGRNHGQVMMLADTLPFRCSQLAEAQG